MSNFQVTIIPASDSIAAEENADTKAFDVRQQSKGAELVLNDIDSLEKVWDTVIQKLSILASKATAAAGQYEMSEIEFSIGIEAGVSVGLVTKGNASVAVKFSKRN